MEDGYANGQRAAQFQNKDITVLATVKLSISPGPIVLSHVCLVIMILCQN